MDMENKHLRIIVESHIPYIRGVMERCGIEVVYAEPSEFASALAADADALIVRTRTRCDAALLGAARRCKLVATATIGTDHIDIPWCRGAGIEVANAPGCNAPAVAQYVVGALAAHYGADCLAGRTLGVVGVGHVGSIVARWARSLGMNVVECDPPRSDAEGTAAYADYRQIARECDAITLHTPLTRADGATPWPTDRLFDRSFAPALRGGQLLINSARGPLASSQAILDCLADGRLSAAVVDCWEDEPQINEQLLERALIATPHIAGYSAEGKIRATQMALDAVSRHFGLPPMHADAPFTPSPPPDAVTAAYAATSAQRLLADTAALRAGGRTAFETLRNTYALRRES